MDLYHFKAIILEHWVQITVIWLAFVKIVTTLRDIFDKTPQSDDNWFEKLASIIARLGQSLFLGKRP